jgi:uncharacterized protein YjbJ (UPF0337 family)
MTDQRTKGTINRFRGTLERAVGRLTGSRRTELHGSARQVQGQTQQAMGGIGDAVHKDRTEPPTS